MDRTGKKNFILEVSKSLFFKFLFCVVFFKICEELVVFILSLQLPDRLVPITWRDEVYVIFWGILWFTIGAILLAFIDVKNFRFNFSLFVNAFVIRFLTMLVLSRIFLYDDEFGAFYYPINQSSMDYFAPSKFYFYLNKVLYQLFSPNILLPKAVNVFIGSLIPYLIYKNSFYIFNEEKKARLAGILTVFLPWAVVYSTTNLKETLTAFVLLLIFLNFIKKDINFLQKLTQGIFLLLFMIWLRGLHWTAIGISIVFVYFIINMGGYKAFIRMSVIGILIFFTLYIIRPDLVSKWISTFVLSLSKKAITGQHISKNAVVISFIDVKHLLSFKTFIVLLLRGLFSPSPFTFLRLIDITKLIASVSMMCWYILFPLAMVSFYHFYRFNPYVFMCLVPFFFIFVSSSVGVIMGANVFRHKMIGAYFLVVMASGAFDLHIIRIHNKIVLLWILGALLFLVLWFIFRF